MLETNFTFLENLRDRLSQIKLKISSAPSA